MKKHFCLIFSLIFLPLFELCALERVISPKPGDFSNKQCLVLNVSDGAECYYSLSGSDPLASGFIYEGPVIIEKDGPVTIKVVSVLDNVRLEEIEIHYNVEEKNPFAENSLEKNFIDSVVSQGILNYSPSSPLKIPEILSYSVGFDSNVFMKGRELKLDTENMLSRYVPCAVTDGVNLWNFVIYVPAAKFGTFAKYSVPFEIKDWNTFVFTGERLIWCIDDGEWSASREPVVLDRTQKHTVKWQNVAFEPGNPVQSFVIPAEPELRVNYTSSGAAVFTIAGDLRFRMKPVYSDIKGINSLDTGLFTQIVFDSFEGDSIGADVEFEFYCDSVYQGKKSLSFKIDRRPPVPPEFIADREGFYARSTVGISLSGEENSDIFYAVSAPLKVSENEFDSTLPLFDSVEAQKFTAYDDTIVLESKSDSAVFYKVAAYSVDDAGNRSEISEYRVIIDEFNYFIDADTAVTDGDGTRDKPFNSFEQALKVINNGKFSHFFVRGNIRLPEGDSLITSDCSFTAVGSSGFTLPSNSSILLRGASFSAQNIIFEKEKLSGRSYSEVEKSSVFVLENSTLAMENCEILGIFSDTGTAFSVRDSVINLKNSGITVQSDTYSCGISSAASKISVTDSRISTIAPTSVNFSISEGTFELENSQCKVVSTIGRIAELADTKATVVANSFTGELERKMMNLDAVWKDELTVILDDSKNSVSGF